MNRRTKRLQKELRLAGAEPYEAEQLSALAARLQPQEPASEPTHRMSMVLITSAASAVMLFAVIVGVAQSSLPGSLMYPLKRASEHVAVAVDPNARATIMMRRADEVKKLVVAHQSTDTIAATLAAYKAEASIYTKHTTNYHVFESCKRSLQEAQAHAKGVQKQAITSTLSSIDTV